MIIKQLQRRYIAAAMISLLLVLFFILGSINIMNYRSLADEADEILALLAEHGGHFPSWEELKQITFANGSDGVELPFSCRLFFAVIDEQGTVLSVNTEKISRVDEETASEYAGEIWRRGKMQGYYQQFRFLRKNTDGQSLMIFLDRGEQLANALQFLFASLLGALIGLTAVFLLLLAMSGRIVRPVAESYEKQKRFITDAGHEIKTPLTIISADADILELEIGENDWVQDIRTQAARMAKLTNDLIFLSKMEEAQRSIEITRFSLSHAVEKTAKPFQTLAKAQEKAFVCQIRPDIFMDGDQAQMEQLVSILLDNALKYSPPDGSIALTLEKKAHSVCLEVSNTTQAGISHEDLEALFDRFYRADASRNSQTGGHGIGLSIAKAIVSAHKGEIKASSQDTRSLKISAAFPIRSERR